MFAYALRHPLRSANPEVANHAELTSLTLSCKLGRDVLFKEMLELSCKEFWRYSNVCCSGYPLGALDSIRPRGPSINDVTHQRGEGVVGGFSTCRSAPIADGGGVKNVA